MLCVYFSLDLFISLLHTLLKHLLPLPLVGCIKAAAALVMAAEGQAADAEDARLISDPAISVADLEEALESFFTKIGYRSFDEVLQVIKHEKVSWKTAPKARAWDLV